jgi:hypothetical protein
MIRERRDAWRLLTWPLSEATAWLNCYRITLSLSNGADRAAQVGAWGRNIWKGMLAPFENLIMLFPRQKPGFV